MSQHGRRSRTANRRQLAAHALIIIFSVVVPSVAFAAGENPATYGPSPSRSHAVAIGNSAIQSRIFHPESARIEWPRALVRGTLTLPGLQPKHGWYTCGYVYELDEKSGLASRNYFLIMIHHSAVALLEIGTTDGIDRPTAICTGLAPKGWVTR